MGVSVLLMWWAGCRWWNDAKSSVTGGDGWSHRAAALKPLWQALPLWVVVAVALRFVIGVCWRLLTFPERPAAAKALAHDMRAARERFERAGYRWDAADHPQSTGPAE